MPPLPPLISGLVLGLALPGITPHGAGTAPPAVSHQPPATSARRPAGTPAPALSGKPITVNAASVEVNYKTHSALYHRVVISQGNIVVRANKASTTMGKDQQNSRWTLEGNVRIHAPPRGSLTADQAVVNILGSRILRATVSGNPARFTQKSPASGKITQGHANQIVYDVKQGTVQLVHDAWLSDGRNQISGSLVTYNVLKDRIEASSPGSGQRVHITITPQAAPSEKKALKNKLPPAPQAPPRSDGTP